ncbi:hypothetical protein FRB94_000302 [Tulasnella sp. JGI-2019a]|nr:hypothetical protein FRB93_003209 [Tulasnella sp. JGI-2019a]KAG9006891.1 hypothetical protein FRB94_000302 [Tulasnella sp. JGI-2019a]
MLTRAVTICRPKTAGALYFHGTYLYQRRSRSLATLAEKTRSDATFTIPVIDFGKFISSDDASAKKSTAKDVVDAFKEVGFVYLKNHGIPQSKIDTAFHQSAEFFALPLQEKLKLAWEDPRSNRGYVARGRERVTQSSDANEIAAMREKAPDFKESIEIGRDWDSTWKNQWPPQSMLPNFKPTFLDFFQTCHDLHARVMQSIAMGLNLPSSFFDDKIQEQYHNMRLLDYPPIDTQLLRAEGQARAGAHSDYGTLTFVFQDSVGGLEVQNPHTKVFHAATPIPGTIVVNVGDLLARWSNDTLRSTLHRVVAPPAHDAPRTPARQSIAFFCNPNGGAVISCLPPCLKEGEKPKYSPVTTEDYIVGRLMATYN